MIYTFDGSYYGFLSVVFESFESKKFDVKPLLSSNFTAELFEEVYDVVTDDIKAKRVLKGLKSKLKSTEVLNIFKVFLSEDEAVWQSLIYCIQQIFLGNEKILTNFGNFHVLKFDQALTRVNRERHRMKAFIRFQKSSDNMFHCMIEPDFNVLPLIAEFFRNRYTDQTWLIYDIKRNYGLFYDLKSVSEVTLSPVQQNALSKTDATIQLDDMEEKYQNLWQQYFKSTNIEARKNMKLHLQHVPRRYWKYLTEKS
ncbi:TIGR03915 family putative DNA repair protein [Soonwooa purpurea]